jgi:hypothetical protein
MKTLAYRLRNVNSVDVIGISKPVGVYCESGHLNAERIQSRKYLGLFGIIIEIQYPETG